MLDFDVGVLAGFRNGVELAVGKTYVFAHTGKGRSCGASCWYRSRSCDRKPRELARGTSCVITTEAVLLSGMTGDICERFLCDPEEGGSVVLSEETQRGGLAAAIRMKFVCCWNYS